MYNCVQPLQPLFNHYNIQYNCVQPLQPLYNHYNVCTTVYNHYNHYTTIIIYSTTVYNHYNHYTTIIIYSTTEYNHYNNYTIMYNKCIQFIYVFHALYMYLQFIFHESYMKKQPDNVNIDRLKARLKMLPDLNL